jgi:hypothetical protein
MEYADSRLYTEMIVDTDRDLAHAADEVVPVMRCHVVRRVTLIEHDQFEVLGERQPEWQIASNGESVAVAERQSTTAGLTALTESNYRPVTHN